MKKPCYTCTDKFIDIKLKTLLDIKRQEAKEYAKKNNFTGSLAIVFLVSGNGFMVIQAQDKTPNQRTAEYLLFDNGIAI